MPVRSSAPTAAQAETSRARASRLRVAQMRILHATDAAGTEYTLALGAAEPTRAYLLRRDKAGAWTCDCFVNRWQRRCSHLEAIEASEAASGEGGRP